MESKFSLANLDSNVKPPSKLNPMLEGTETPTTFSSQLHCWLEGKKILVGEILELDIPLDYFFGGI